VAQRRSRFGPGAFVYIISNKSHTLYTGCTVDLLARVREHKEKRFKDHFTARYNFDRLVYYEWLPTEKEGAAREKQIKAWTRAKRVALIQVRNPKWLDLSATFADLLMAR
jgi:putative endonuclease